MSFESKECQKKSHKKVNLSKYIKATHRRANFRCIVCKKKFADDINLMRHVVTVLQGRRDFECRNVIRSLVKILNYNNKSIQFIGEIEITSVKNAKWSSPEIEVRKHKVTFYQKGGTLIAMNAKRRLDKQVICKTYRYKTSCTNAFWECKNANWSLATVLIWEGISK